MVDVDPKLKLLQQWIEKQIGNGPIATLSTASALAMVGAGLLPAATVKLLVDEALAQGRLKPPCFFYGALLDLTEQISGGLQFGHVSPGVLEITGGEPPPSCQLLHNSQVAALIRRQLEPSRN
jgi:hypothetical protein